MSERYSRGGNEPADAWDRVDTGRWVVSWSDYLDYHNMPFERVVCASREVALDVVREVAAWLLRFPYGSTRSYRVTKHAVEECDSGMQLVLWEERRSVKDIARTQSVEVDGQTYHREVKHAEFGEWVAQEPLRVELKGSTSLWTNSRWGPAPDGRTREVLIRVRPEVVEVLTACGEARVVPVGGGA